MTQTRGTSGWLRSLRTESVCPPSFYLAHKYLDEQIIL